jgi:hypothetical protein
MALLVCLTISLGSSHFRQFVIENYRSYFDINYCINSNQREELSTLSAKQEANEGAIQKELPKQP